MYGSIYMMRKVRVKALLEMSDHDGCCSDNDCKYWSKEKVIVIEVPDEYEDEPLGFIEEIDQKKWNKFLPFPAEEYKTNYPESDRYILTGYCDNDPEAEERGLGTHDFCYTIYSIEIFDDMALQE